MSKISKKIPMNKSSMKHDELKKIGKIASYIRSASKLPNGADVCCEVCARKNKGKIQLSNHHVVKVEFLSELAYAYELVDFEKNAKKSGSRLDYEEVIKEYGIKTRKSKNSHPHEKVQGFKENVDLHIPVIPVCNEHHEVFHELMGDKKINFASGLTLNETGRIIEILEDQDAQIEKWCLDVTEGDADYKKMYGRYWDYTRVNILENLKDILVNLELDTESNIEDNRLEYEMLLEYQEGLLKQIADTELMLEGSIAEVADISNIDLYE